MKYVKKPVVIEAFRLYHDTTPMWFLLAADSGAITCCENHIVIHTMEGDMLASRGDYIIKGVAGEIYPCKAEIFDVTYEKYDIPKKKSKAELLARTHRINVERRKRIAEYEKRRKGES